MATHEPTDASNLTAWIDGARPHFQTLRITRAEDRVFLGAKGWNKAMGRSEWVSLELTAAGLHRLAAEAAKALAGLQEA